MRYVVHSNKALHSEKKYKAKPHTLQYRVIKLHMRYYELKTRPHFDLDGWIDHPVVVLLISRLGMSFSNTYWCTTCVYWAGYSNTTRSMQLCIITRMPITLNGAFYTNTSQEELTVGLEMEMVLTYTTNGLEKRYLFTQKCIT